MLLCACCVDICMWCHEVSCSAISHVAPFPMRRTMLRHFPMLRQSKQLNCYCNYSTAVCASTVGPCHHVDDTVSNNEHNVKTNTMYQNEHSVKMKATELLLYPLCLLVLCELLLPPTSLRFVVSPCCHVVGPCCHVDMLLLSSLLHKVT